MRVRPLLTVVLLLLLLASASRAQEPTRLWQERTETFISFPRDTVALARQFLVDDSVDIVITPELRRGERDLVVLRREGALLLTPAFRERLDSARATMRVRYRALPFRFAPEYSKRTLVQRSDSVAGGALLVASTSQPLSIESIFGSELNKSGYIGRGFTLGSNRDLNINSGFRLQLSGQLSEDIAITGALTDENTPIQPEGNTRSIQELDKVFIKLSSRSLSATLGDFSLIHNDSEFGRYNRKLSGVLGEGAIREGSASLSYASLKGTWHSMQFNGLDGVQGPYRLTGRNGELPVLVLAGTERVYVDGVAMVRGENNDYVIEYASGEVFFTPRRLITSYSRITVDYEYAERQYTRSMVTASTKATLFGDALSAGARFIRESDDADNPIDQSFDDTDRALLADAGDDATLASRPGAVYVGLDTARGTGAGLYARIDTLIGGTDRVVFRYQPGSDSATWAVSFSFVGAGRGDYRRKSVGVFEFAGVNSGDYAPLRLLPLPRAQQLFNVTMALRPLRDLSIGGEIAASNLDRNRLSMKDDADDAGLAGNLTASWSNAATPLGTLDVRARYRGMAEHFTAIDRINDIEFARRWDAGQSANNAERLGEAEAVLRSSEALSFRLGSGSIAREGFSSQRFDGGIALVDAARDSSLPNATWNVEYIDSDRRDSGVRGRWLRQLANADFAMDFGTPRLRVEQEHRRSTVGDSLLAESQAFVDIRPGVLLPDIAGMQFSADFGMRMEDAVLNGALRRRSVDILQQYGWTLRSWSDLSASATMTVRDRRFEKDFAARGEQDVQTILTRVQSRYAPFKGAVNADALYEVSTERTSRLERVFLKVPYGQGGYVYAGDLNNNGVQDENEFEPTRYEGEYVQVTVPTAELFPVIDLKSSLRLRLQPDRYFERAGDDVLVNVLRALSSESFLRIDEKSSLESTSDIYLLHLSRFLNDSTTIRGFQNLRQDFFLFERASDFSLRLRFDERLGASQFALLSERSYRRERSLRVKTQLVREIGLQTDFVALDDAVRSTDGGTRARDISSTEWIADLSYRPWQELEIGFVLTSRTATDRNPAVAVEANISSLALRSVASFDGPGRLRVELERSDVGFSTEVERYAYELTDGRAEGQSWIWRVNLDYRLTSFMQATISYLGRSEAERDVVHNARAEVKAFF
ncbi:MAG TPA: hypothetical protein PK916_03655 [Bacteroidota bacterium]|nr:hypothetical protein [Bacteroidota bacterium]